MGLQVSKELDQDAGVVSEISLNHALRTALTSTSASRVDDEDVLERLRARKDRSATGERLVALGGGLKTLLHWQFRVISLPQW